MQTKTTNGFRTAESVSPRHPDKICDQISDAVLDECLRQDPFSRVAMETMGGHGKIYLTGELTTSAKLDFKKIVESVIPGYKLEVNVVKQSPNISGGVDTGGAGDQGIMVGYATAETPEMIPLEVKLSRNLNRHVFDKHPYDGKTQITRNGNKVQSIVASFQNVPKVELEKLVREWMKKNKISCEKLFINPVGDWTLGSFDADTGLTGRKLAVDNYGPHIPVGGGAFSGKDATKVDRSAAYMARKIAVDTLKKKKAKEVYVYLAYSIGVREPVMAVSFVDGKQQKITGYDLTPLGIIKFLNLRKPQFQETAEYGHFGNGFKWDR